MPYTGGITGRLDLGDLGWGAETERTNLLLLDWLRVFLAGIGKLKLCPRRLVKSGYGRSFHASPVPD
jgi:hypothetical protein